MPNTLAHIAIQSLLTRSVSRFRGLFTAALLGCIIPDIPWIVQRLVQGVGTPIDPYQLRAYSTVQATLLFSAILSGACAFMFSQPWRAWFAMSAGSLVHLLLDASEKKWANGVHFLAPWDWTHVNWGRIWPEHWLIWTVSACGLATFFYFAATVRPPRSGLRVTMRRGFGMSAMLVIYFSGPFALLDGPFLADNHFIATLDNADERPGKEVEIDRASVFQKDGTWYLQTFANESLILSGSIPDTPGIYSVAGSFDTPNTLSVAAWHRHDGFRDVASLLGVLLIAGWVAACFFNYGRRSGSRRIPVR